jgi:hypothetical protein
MLIIRNVDLTESPNSIEGYETCAASVDEVVIFTSNRSSKGPRGGFAQAFYSSDHGETFTEIDTMQICAPFSQIPCCDQMVIYIPKIHAFMWVLQTNEGNYVCSLASLEELKSSHGNLWHSYLLTASNLGGSITDRLDYPEIAVGDNFLYMTCTLVNKGMVAIRFSLADLSAAITKRASLPGEYLFYPGMWSIRPAQNTGPNGYFVIQKSDSELIMIKWPELYIGSGAGSGSGSGPSFPSTPSAYSWDIPIATTPTLDWEVKLPEGPPVNVPWLSVDPNPPSKISARITGLTRNGGKLWVAWTGARKIKLKDGSTVPAFAFPHISIVIIDITTLGLDHHYIYRQDEAFAWPSLATNSEGHVGMSYSVCRNGSYPRCAIALLTDGDQNFSTRDMKTTTSAPARECGGHYTSIRIYPNSDWFSASNWYKIVDSLGKEINHPHYILWMGW